MRILLAIFTLCSLAAQAAPLTFYSNGALQNGWWDNSGATHNLNSTTVLDGTDHTLSVTYSAWSSINFFGGTYINLTGLNTLTIRANAGANVNPLINVKLYQSTTGWTTPQVRLGQYCPGGVIPTNSWATCNIPLSAFGTLTGTTGGIYLQEAAGRSLTPLYMNNMGIVTLGGDTTPPTVSMTSPAAGTVSGTISLDATAADNVGVVGVQFLVDGTNTGAEDTTSPYSVSLDTTTLSSGNHTLAARARDAAGNTTTSTGVVVTVNNPDVTPPTVSVTAPTNGATVSGTILLSATAADNVGVVGVQFMVDSVNVGTEDTTSPYSVMFDTTSLTGSHTVQAVARDAANNVTTSTIVNFNVSADAGSGGGGTATYTPFAALPNHSDGVPTSAQWAHGAPMFVKDLVGGDLVGFFKGNNSLRAIVSTNSGATWFWVNPASNINGSPPLAITQSPDGNVHLIGWSWAYGVAYTRLVLARDANQHINGFSASVVSLAFPSSPNAADLSADIIAGSDSSGNPILLYTLYDDYTSSNRGRVVAGKTTVAAGLTPTATAHFVSLSNSAGVTQLDLMGSDAWASPHNAGVLMAQHPVSKDVYFQWGPMNTGDGLTLNTLPLKRARATSSGTSFSVVSTTTIATYSGGWGVQNYSVSSTPNAVWFTYGTNSSAVVIDRVDAAGTTTVGAIPSPLTTAHSGGQFALTVNAAETQAFFGGRIGYDADVTEPKVIKFWDGSTWTTFQDNVNFEGFRVCRSQGWDQGLVIMQNHFDYTTHRPWVATIRTN